MKRRRVTYFVFGLLALVGALALTTILTTRYLSTPKTHWAAFKARTLLQACEVYRENPDSGGRYTTSLTDLQTPPFGGAAFLRDGENDLLDPWGHPFRYAVVKDQTGGQEVYVWAELAAEGKFRLVGAKRTREGKAELFGLER